MIRAAKDLDACRGVIIPGKESSLGEWIADVQSIRGDKEEVIVAKLLGQFRAAIQEELLDFVPGGVIIAFEPYLIGVLR